MSSQIIDFKEPRPFRRDDIPVEVITRDKGIEVFQSLAEARDVYPDLDLFKHGKRFTWAMHGSDPETGAIRARFEDWATYELLTM